VLVGKIEKIEGGDHTKKLLSYLNYEKEMTPDK
jgi:hypothetical protein